MKLCYGMGGTIHTSAAAAAAALGSSLLFSSPRVLGGPPTLGIGFATLLGMLALVAGGGAEPRVRPWLSKGSLLDCLPQRLPIGGGDDDDGVWGGCMGVLRRSAEQGGLGLFNNQGRAG